MGRIVERPSVDFSAFGAVEKYPDRKIVGELLETVFVACFGKDDVVYGKAMPSVAVHEPRHEMRRDGAIRGSTRRTWSATGTLRW